MCKPKFVEVSSVPFPLPETGAKDYGKLNNNANDFYNNIAENSSCCSEKLPTNEVRSLSDYAPRTQLDIDDVFGCSADRISPFDAFSACSSVTQSPLSASTISSSSFDDSPFSPSATNYCPVNSRCELSKYSDVQEHLISAHKAQQCTLILDPVTQCGSIEAFTPIFLNHAKPRRSALIINCENRRFLWSLESRLRADGEIQVSITVRYLMDSSSNNSSNKSLCFDSNSCDESNNASSASVASGSDFKVSVSVERGDGLPNLVWEHRLNYNEDLSGKRQDFFVSMGRALVVLHPTHSDAFKKADDSNNNNMSGDMYKLKVCTVLQKDIC